MAVKDEAQLDLVPLTEWKSRGGSRKSRQENGSIADKVNKHIHVRHQKEASTPSRPFAHSSIHPLTGHPDKSLSAWTEGYSMVRLHVRR